MPRRRTSIHNSTSTSPPPSSRAVSEVLGALTRKLSSQQVETTSPSPITAIRRPSLSMDSILHPGKKDKKSDDKGEKKRTSSIIKPLKSKDRPSSHNSPLASPALRAQKGGRFEMIMESPPAVLYGSVNNSSGSLLGGRLKFTVDDPAGEVTLESFTMTLRVITTTKKPIHKECKCCAVKHEVLNTWNFLTHRKTFYSMGDNQFPWSFLLQGNLPATTDCQLGGIKYAFVVEAQTSVGEKITFEHPLKVQRAIHVGVDKSSIRIFPPTNLTCRVIMPQIVWPIGKFPVQMTLSGVVEKKKESQTRWRLKKLMWRVEENSKVKSTPCDKHKDKVKEGKAIQHTESKQLGSDEMKSGWKTDFDTIGGEIAFDFEASVATKPSHHVACDVDSQSGLEVKHNLIIELIVAEEFVPNKNTNIITPTGAARVLRMQFALTVSEREGMGISWDAEMPPMYEDVPPSPPGYGNSNKFDGAFGGAIIMDYNGPELEYPELERIHTSNPNDPPVYRERDTAGMTAGLPMRDDVEAGPSQIRRGFAGINLDDLEAETPHFALRGRQDSVDDNGDPVEDYGEGSTGAAPPTNAQH